MVDETQDQAPQDPIAQLKGEFSRKMANTEAKLAEVVELNKQFLEKLSAQQTQRPEPQAPKTEEDLDTLIYSDPKKAAHLIKEQAKSEVMQSLSQSQAQQSRITSTINTLVSEYPELNNQHNPLTKKAIEIYMSLPEDERASPAAYKLAVKEAAQELNVKPLSKRSQEEYMPQSGRSSEETRKPKNAVSPEMEQMASIFGIDLSKKEVKERVLKNSSRNWASNKKLGE